VSGITFAGLADGAATMNLNFNLFWGERNQPDQPDQGGLLDLNLQPGRLRERTVGELCHQLDGGDCCDALEWADAEHGRCGNCHGQQRAGAN
jgi:hypothetical protein